MNKRIALGLTVLLAGFAMLGSQVFAQSPVAIVLVAGYAKGNNNFSVVVKDTPNTKLGLYVNDKNPVIAKVNNTDWATFRNVKLVGSGKISFTKVLKGGKQKPINYTRHYLVVNGQVQFSSNALVAKPAATPTPAPTPSATVQQTTTPTSTPPPAPAAPAPSSSPAQTCYPLSDEGGCYEPGEYCRDSDHGSSGVAGDGAQITCLDNDGWRWEPN